MGIFVLTFSLVTIAALAFVCWPLWRRAGKGRLVAVASLASLMLAIAAGAYIFVGEPRLAWRTFAGPQESDVRGLVTMLAWRMRERPEDPRGWFLLGRSYLSMGDSADAAIAFKRAVLVSPPREKAALLSAYGVALTEAAMGHVTPDAEAAFSEALARSPRDVASRYFLGDAYAERHDKVRALAIWKSLLADTPPNAPWRGALLDRIAFIDQAGQAPPDIAAMVQGLADRLKSAPDDQAGWRELVRAYVVLGKVDKARQALTDARHALVHDQTALAALSVEAHDLKLEK